MITKHEKAKGFWWRLLATLPVLALLLIVNVRATAQGPSKTDKTVNEFNTDEITDVTVPKVDNDTVLSVCEVMPEYPGGAEMLVKYLAENITYPEEAKEKNISGRVFINFVIEKDGSVGDVNVMKGIGGGCDDEAVRVVKAMPKWKPGMNKGKAVRVNYVLPINFKLDESESAKAEQQSKDDIYEAPETMPTFRGGVTALQDYIKDNLVVPEKYQNMDTKVEYRVLVKFVVAEDGSVTNVELQKADPSKKDLNDEAVRVVKNMPKWSPGKVNGKCVKVKYTLPVLFKLGK